MNQDTILKLRQTQIEILDEVVRICNKHNLTYFLVAGTLLGAVRYKGFIPWDEDIDIAMPRNDYERFKALAKSELNPKYFFQDCISDPTYYLSLAKVRKNNTLYEEFYTREIKSHKGIFIDIFILDNAKKEKGLFQSLQSLTVLLLRNILWTKKVVKLYKRKKPLYLICYILSLLIPARPLAKALMFTMSINKNDSSMYFVNLTSRRSHTLQTMAKSRYIPAAKLEFESKKYCVPNDWDYMLKRLYGDYHVLPEKSEIAKEKKAVKVEFYKEN